MQKKVSTIKLQGKDYAQVATRVKEFREQCPHGSIETKPTILDEGSILFTTTIIKDLSDEFSARATGSALGTSSDQKAFEKLETISVGRALALLGYAASGEIASSEEMEDFYAYKDEKIKEAINLVYSAKTIDELKEIFKNLGNTKAVPEVIKAKDEMKEKLTTVQIEVPEGKEKKPRAKKVKVEEGEVLTEELPKDLQ